MKYKLLRITSLILSFCLIFVAINFTATASQTKLVKQSFLSDPSINKVESIKTRARTTSSITLKFNYNGSADGFNVYRYYRSSKTTMLVKTVTNRTAKITGLKAGNVYEFQIAAFKNNGSKVSIGPFSNIHKTVTRPHTPQITSISFRSNKTVSLSWNSVQSSGYIIHYSTNSDFSKSKKITINDQNKIKTKFKLKSNANTVYVKICAYKNPNKVRSKFSLIYSATKG